MFYFLYEHFSKRFFDMKKMFSLLFALILIIPYCGFCESNINQALLINESYYGATGALYMTIRYNYLPDRRVDSILYSFIDTGTSMIVVNEYESSEYPSRSYANSLDENGQIDDSQSQVFHYDETGQMLCRLTYDKNGIQIRQENYTYYDNCELRSYNDHPQDSNLHISYSYTYDECGRKMNRMSSTIYAKVGEKEIRESESHIDTSYEYNNEGQLIAKYAWRQKGTEIHQVTQYQYDSYGNIISELNYDYPVTSEMPRHRIEYEYDYSGRDNNYEPQVDSFQTEWDLNGQWQLDYVIDMESAGWPDIDGYSGIDSQYYSKPSQTRCFNITDNMITFEDGSAYTFYIELGVRGPYLEINSSDESISYSTFAVANDHTINVLSDGYVEIYHKCN